MPDIEKAIANACREYRKTGIGRSIPLTILRSIYRNAFLDGSRWCLESLGAAVPPPPKPLKRLRRKAGNK